LDSSEHYHQANIISEHGINLKELKVDFKQMMLANEVRLSKLFGGIGTFLMKKNKMIVIHGYRFIGEQYSVNIEGKESKKMKAKRSFIANRF